MWSDGDCLYLDARELHLLLMAAVRQATGLVAVEDTCVDGLILGDLARALGAVGEGHPERLYVIGPATAEQGRHLAHRMIDLDDAMA